MSGEVITFYSYKGGTGRTMALANVACALALAGKGPVLVVDWDLEAPGLHHFLQPMEPLGDGVLELFGDLPLGDTFNTREAAASFFAEQFSLDRYVRWSTAQGVHLLPAGRFDETYARRVSEFSWNEILTKAPHLLPAFAEYLADRYPYVLIDSRTGITDVSGICTMIMPSKLVVVFTPNRQSLTGIPELVRKAAKYRSESNDWRPLAVFPLPSRIEPAREQLLQDWRHGVLGFQPTFQKLFQEVYGLDECDLTEYFTEVQIQYVPDYAYGEQVAVLIETDTRLSLKRSYEEFAERLIGLEGPWQDPKVVEAERQIREKLATIDSKDSAGLRSVVETYRGNERIRIPELPDILGKAGAALRAEGKDARELLWFALDAEERESGVRSPAAVVRRLELAQAYSDVGFFEEAQSMGFDALLIQEEVLGSEHPSLVRTLDFLGAVSLRMGDLEGARTVIERATALQGMTAMPLERAERLQTSAALYGQLGDIDRAKQSIAEALRILRESNATSGEIAAALRVAAIVERGHGNLAAAKHLLQEAVELHRDGDRPADFADTLAVLAQLNADDGNHQQAMQLFQDVYFRRSTFLDKSDPSLVASLRDIASMATRLGDFATARSRYEDALTIARAVPEDHPVQPTIRRELTEVLLALGEQSRAYEMAEEALRSAEQTHRDEEIALARVTLSTIVPDRLIALTHLMRASELYERLGDQTGRAETAMRMARLASELGNMDMAVEHYQRANDLYKALGQRAKAAVATRELNKLKGGWV